MTKETLKRGDVVELLSGGLPMTITDVDGDVVSCVWHTAAGEVVRESFDADLLQVPKRKTVQVA